MAVPWYKWDKTRDPLVIGWRNLKIRQIQVGVGQRLVGSKAEASLKFARQEEETGEKISKEVARFASFLNASSNATRSLYASLAQLGNILRLSKRDIERKRNIKASMDVVLRLLQKFQNFEKKDFQYEHILEDQIRVLEKLDLYKGKTQKQLVDELKAIAKKRLVFVGLNVGYINKMTSEITAIAGRIISEVAGKDKLLKTLKRDTEYVNNLIMQTLRNYVPMIKEEVVEAVKTGDINRIEEAIRLTTRVLEIIGTERKVEKNFIDNLGYLKTLEERELKFAMEEKELVRRLQKLGP